MVSVIIPCYNARQYICEALASAVAQEYVHEVILVDDCSTDDSVSCLQYRPCADDAVRKPDTDDHAYPGENHTCRAGENECDQLFFRGCTKGDSAEISDAAQRGA